MTLSEAVERFRSLDEKRGWDALHRKTKALRKKTRAGGGDWQQTQMKHGISARSRQMTKRS